MLQKITLQCTYSGEAKASYNWGSLLHGAMMELLPKETASVLHENNLRPFSQYVLPMPGNRLEWKLGLWGNEVSETVAQVVMSTPCIEIKHKGIKLEVVASEQKKQSERDFFTCFFTTETPCRRYELEFLTPCTHKSAGEYVLFPSPELIIQSLYMRFCAFSQDFSLDDAETMAQLAANLYIARYSLRSAQYHLEGTKVAGYIGRVTLYICGPEQLARLAGMLLSFAEYAGVGIKTSLGMGGCRIIQISHKTNITN